MRCYSRTAQSLPRVKCCSLSDLKFVVSVREKSQTKGVMYCLVNDVMPAYCLCGSKFICPPSTAVIGLWPLSPPLVWPPVWIVEPHQQHITAPQCRY